MYLTVTNQMRNIPARDFKILVLLCRLSKNMYNEALYNVRQEYIKNNHFLSYNKNYHKCKNSENYKLLGTDIAQQTMHKVDENFKSFIELSKKAENGYYDKEKVNIPHYLDKEGYYIITIPNRYFNKTNFKLPMSHKFEKEHGIVKFDIPEILHDKKIVEIRIRPNSYNRIKFFYIEYVYEQNKDIRKLDTSKFLGIDLGLDNLATCVTNDGASFIIDGKQLKSYNQWYNKENARLQSLKDKQGVEFFTNRQVLNLRKRNNRINYIMSVTARKIINFCLENNIGNLVIGVNKGWKQSINIGKQNNQNFVQIPHAKLIKKLQYLCQFYGIKYFEQEESYTSKASFFDNDEITIYGINKTKHKFSGRRISRGQYKTSSGMIFNADVNGALNILRKSNLVSLIALQHRGCVNQPVRIRIY